MNENKESYKDIGNFLKSYLPLILPLYWNYQEVVDNVYLSFVVIRIGDKQQTPPNLKKKKAYFFIKSKNEMNINNLLWTALK